MSRHVEFMCVVEAQLVRFLGFLLALPWQLTQSMSRSFRLKLTKSVQDMGASSVHDVHVLICFPHATVFLPHSQTCQNMKKLKAADRLVEREIRQAARDCKK
jgi:hypothetical protein